MEENITNFDVMFARQFQAVLEAIMQPSDFLRVFEDGLEALKIALEVKSGYDRFS